MSRLAATIRTDVRMQLRNGFYLATAFIMMPSILVLRWLPAEAAALILPVMILETVLVNTFYFVGGLLLLERVEGTFVAQSVTPLRDHEYLAAKLATLTALSLVEGLVIAMAVLGAGAWLVSMAVGIALSAVLFCLAGVALVLRYDSINEFLLPSVVYASLLSLPVLGSLGIGPTAWYQLHPIHGPLSMMQTDAPQPAGRFIHGICYALLWMVPAYLACRRALGRARAA